MSSQFNNEVLLTELLSKLVPDVEKIVLPNISLKGISDNSKSQPFTITTYIKGKKPEGQEGLVLLTKSYLEGFNCVIVENPRKIMVDIINHIEGSIGFKKHNGKNNIHPTVVIGQNVTIEDDVEICENTIIEHNAIINSGTRIGKNCLIRSGATIGGQGYNYLDDGDLRLKIPDLGGVIIKDNVEIGANTCVAKGIVGDTLLEDDVKVDNLVHIAHDCIISKRALIIAGATLCGYVEIGENARVSPNACIKQRVKVGKNSVVGLGAVLLKNVKDNTTVFGNPAKPIKTIRNR